MPDSQFTCWKSDNKLSIVSVIFVEKPKLIIVNFQKDKNGLLIHYCINEAIKDST